MSVLLLESGNTMNIVGALGISLGLMENISSYIPPLVTIQIQYFGDSPDIFGDT